MKRGSVVSDGETATLTFERVLPHAPELVWEAIATPDGLKAWLMCTSVKIERGTIEMVSGPAGYHSIGKILTWDPPRVLAYEWNVAPVPEMPRGEHAIFRYELTPRGDSTLLTVVYRRITAAVARGFLPGTHVFLDRLEAQLARAPLPDFATRFAEVRAEYPDWEAHASAPGQ